MDPDVFAVGDVRELLQRNDRAPDRAAGHRRRARGAVESFRQARPHDQALAQHTSPDPALEDRSRGHHKPHADPAQKRFVFSLLRERLAEGAIAQTVVEEEIERRHIRRDALAVIATITANATGCSRRQGGDRASNQNLLRAAR